MVKVIEGSELLAMDNEKLLNLIKDKGVLLYLYNGRLNEGRVTDIIQVDNNSSIIMFDVGIKTYRQTVKRIEILENNVRFNKD